MGIDEILTDIDRNNQKLMSLLSQKKRVVERIRTAMDLRAYTKTPLNEKQRQYFDEFTGVYQQEALNLSHSLKAITGTGLHKHTDPVHLHNSLKSLSDKQTEAIHSLNSIIGAGERTLSELW